MKKVNMTVGPSTRNTKVDLIVNRKKPTPPTTGIFASKTNDKVIRNNDAYNKIMSSKKV